jgi:hypothetical protein
MTRSQMRRENPKPSEVEFWNARRMSTGVYRSQLRTSLQAARRPGGRAAPDQGGGDDCRSDAVTVWFYDTSFTGFLLPWGVRTLP